MSTIANLQGISQTNYSLSTDVFANSNHAADPGHTKKKTSIAFKATGWTISYNKHLHGVIRIWYEELTTNNGPTLNPWTFLPRLKDALGTW